MKLFSHIMTLTSAEIIIENIFLQERKFSMIFASVWLEEKDMDKKKILDFV